MHVNPNVQIATMHMDTLGEFGKCGVAYPDKGGSTDTLMRPACLTRFACLARPTCLT